MDALWGISSILGMQQREFGSWRHRGRKHKEEEDQTPRRKLAHAGLVVGRTKRVQRAQAYGSEYGPCSVRNGVKDQDLKLLLIRSRRSLPPAPSTIACGLEGGCFRLSDARRSSAQQT